MKPRISLWALALSLSVLAGCTGIQQSAPVNLASYTSQTPVIVSASHPEWQGTNRSVYVQFNRDMDATTINANTFYIRGVSGTYRYDAPNRIAYLKPSSPLADNSSYQVVLTDGIHDTQGTKLAAYSFSFNTRDTKDTSPPTVTPSVEVVGQGCVSPTGPIWVRFDEDMDSSTINSSTFYVSDSADLLVAGTVNYDAVTRMASFTPAANFIADATYTATVTTGAQDLGGVGLASNFSFQFTTCPTPPQNASFCSYTKGGYAGPGTPGQIFNNYFSQVFSMNLTLGVNDGAGPLHDARWTAAAPGPTSLQQYLTSAAMGPSGAFPGDSSNPTATANGQLPEQAAALALNIGFSGYDSDGMPAGFGQQTVSGIGSLSGSTVEDILGYANYALSGQGLPEGYTYDSLSALLDNLNQSWDNCTESDWAKQHLSN